MAHDATHAARGGRYGRRMVTADEIDPAAFEAVDAVFAAFCGGERTPGISYGVVIDGAVVHAGAAGVATPGGEGLHVDSVLRIASMTKSFTAAAALALRDDGLLRLDEPVASYVPELAAWTMPTRDSPRDRTAASCPENTPAQAARTRHGTRPATMQATAPATQPQAAGQFSVGRWM